MKERIWQAVVSFCLIICIITFSFTGIFASASTVTYSTFADHYFSEIKTNIPRNQRGSCGFVALSMILSFYNFYYNDNFVEEWFEDSILRSCGSNDYPNGVPQLYLENNHLPRDEQGNIDDGAYVPFLIDNINTYLQFYLIGLAATNDPIDGWERFLDFNDESYGINIQEAKLLMEHYLYDCRGFSVNEVVVHTESMSGEISSDSELYDRISTLVRNGIPVCYLAQNSTETKGHIMVAYSCSDEDIKVHRGYSYGIGSSTTTLLNSGYVEDAAILWLETKDALPHVCSYNYRWANTERILCACNAYKGDLLHPEHTHSVAEYESYNSSNHTYTCYCGQTFTASHSYNSYTSLGATGHRAYCNCGYFTVETHGFNAKRCNKCGYIDNTYYQPWQNPDDPKDELLE